MTHAVVAYIPVLHDGYRRFLEAHGRDRRLYVIGPECHADYRPLARDIRALDAQLVASAIESWAICSSVTVLTPEVAEEIARQRHSLVMPAEDVSYQMVERYFARCEVRFDTVFLRWDKTRTVQMLRPQAHRTAGLADVVADLSLPAEAAADDSVDWWRQVGAAIRFADGEVRSAHNEHHPHRLSAYTVGDPRSNFFKGVAYDLSTAVHAEARLIAQAARDGRPTSGAVMYVTAFPCPACAKLIGASGISRLYFRDGYAVLDGQDTLADAGVEIVQAA